MIAEQSLSFLYTTATLIFSGLAVLVTALLCLLSWHRSGYQRATGLLEGLRLLLVVLVVITLNQPEWSEQFEPNWKPQLVVLWDDSRSMETKDVVNPQYPSDLPHTRAETARPLLEEAHWKSLAERMDVVFEPFSSQLEASREGTDLNAALDKLAARQTEAPLAGVVLVSDGDWNVGSSPVRAATRLRMQNVPVFSVGVGSDTPLPDLEVLAFDAPTFGVLGKVTRLPFTIGSTFPRECEVTVRLECGPGEELTKQVRVPAMGHVQETFTWRPARPGDFPLTLRVLPAQGEKITDNNQAQAKVAIRDEALHVLLVESYPRWEYRYLRNALERDPGVDVSCLLFQPNLDEVGGGRGYIKTFPSPSELARYDAIFLGDVGVGARQLTVEQCQAISQAVRDQAAGLVFLPGFRGYENSLLSTPLGELYPVVLDPSQPKGWGSRVPGRFELTSAGRQSLLTALESSPEANADLWRNLPGFQWYAAATRAKAGTEVLAVHGSESSPEGRVPLLVTRTFGTGKVLFMGTDGAWRWREGVEDKYHYRFWGQVVRWMAYQRNMAGGESLRLFYTPNRPRTDDVLTLNANVVSVGGEPMKTGNVVLQLVSPAGKTESVRLQPAGQDAWGLFTGTYTPHEPGTHKLTLTCRETGATLETTLDVQGSSREKLGRPARFDVLQEISDVSRGKLLRVDDAAALLDELAALPEPKPIVRRAQLWCHPLWAGTLVTLLGVFWVGRKMNGVI